MKPTDLLNKLQDLVDKEGVKASGPHRIKLKLAHHELADQNGCVHFDVDPAETNPFKVAKITADTIRGDDRSFSPDLWVVRF